MIPLLQKVTALDPGAGAALRAIAYFDALIETQAGIEAVVRAAATLAGCPAGAALIGRGGSIRVLTTGQRCDGPPAGLIRTGDDFRGSTVWIERCYSEEDDSDRRSLDALILERLARTTQIILDRTRPTIGHTDPASLELLLNEAGPMVHRLEAAERLGLSIKKSYSVRVFEKGNRQSRSSVGAELAEQDVEVTTLSSLEDKSKVRCAVGPVLPVKDLFISYQLARETFRLTSKEPTAGPTFLRADDVMGLLALAPGCETVAAMREVEALEKAIALSPWALATMVGISGCISIRVAAEKLHIHHSTLQARVDRIDHCLGWSLTTSQGRTRLTVALALRSFQMNK